MPDQQYNPIQWVQDVTTETISPRVVIACPSKYDWTVNDISNSDAGRCESGLMHKNRIARKRKLELEWQNVPIATANAVLTAFAPEYVDVYCLDPLVGDYVVIRFYSGDQGASAYNVRINAWTVSFNIIEQ